MSWIISRKLCESLHYSQELGAEYSEENCSDGEQFARLNVISTPHPFWHRDKTTDFSKLSRFGLTYRPLTESRGEELLTSFRAGFPVRTFPSPAQERDWTVKDQGYGESSPVLLAKYDPDSHSLKTAQHSLFEDSTESCVTLPASGTMQNGRLWARTMSAAHTDEKEYGYWPTPKLQDSRHAIRRHMKPGCTHWKGNLGEVVASIHYIDITNGGRLNPNWVEWLMGWPIGWTDLEPLATDRFRQWRQSHGQF